MNPFAVLETDRVRIVKKNGEIFEDIPASVQGNRISITTNQILIDVGDFIERNLSNGSSERYVVQDPGFQEAFHAIPAGYQMHVQKQGVAPRSNVPGAVHISVTGNHARINHQSTDNSINIAGGGGYAELISKLREEISVSSLEKAEKKEATEAIDVVEQQFASGAPKKKIVTALLATIPVVGQVVEVGKSIVEMCKS
ncbi:hypothetical protein [Chromobacterium haemolyticum]|uniref:hypothetical protein n=1 Tax=Chromobacterium haemolyticum TaxID=394935 RepID=UPI0013B3C89B|nr:hypothetical protein [Chromobacterium haemolyticum]